MSDLILKSGVTLFLMATVRSGMILGLLVLWTALPTMRCLLPIGTLTPAERACCKSMAGHCGETPSSHPCCKKTVVSDQSAISQSAPRVTPIVLVHSGALTPWSVAPTTESRRLPGPLNGPSPPSLQSSSSILRI
jgi:hypothetical protein